MHRAYFSGLSMDLAASRAPEWRDPVAIKRKGGKMFEAARSGPVPPVRRFSQGRMHNYDPAIESASALPTTINHFLLDLIDVLLSRVLACIIEPARDIR